MKKTTFDALMIRTIQVTIGDNVKKLNLLD